MLAVNHPNSFLDAIILDILFDEPIISLARGDAFFKPWIATILRSLNILPVFREREGKEHLHRNYHTFDECLSIFKKNGVVLIFTEALCENEWHLRPLKKGTARMAVTAWQEDIPVSILPIGLNYNSFHLFGKIVHVNIGNVITQQQVSNRLDENGKLLNELTGMIECQLVNLVYEIEKHDKKQLQETFAKPISFIKKVLLGLPALCGFVVHVPLYFPAQKIIAKKARHTGHYDSIMAGVLLLSYPLYVAACTLLLLLITKNWWALSAIGLFPFFAWSYIQLSPQTDK